MLIIVVIITLLDNSKNIFLVLGEEPNEGVTGSVGTAKKNKTSINFSKANTTFCLSLYYNGDESYLQNRDIEN